MDIEPRSAWSAQRPTVRAGSAVEAGVAMHVRLDAAFPFPSGGKSAVPTRVSSKNVGQTAKRTPGHGAASETADPFNTSVSRHSETAGAEAA